MCVLLITRLLRLVGRCARKPVNHTSWVAVVTPTDLPKSVRNRCLIELFCGVVCVVTCPFDISVGVGAFVIGLGQISSFLSWHELHIGQGQREAIRSIRWYSLWSGLKTIYSNKINHPMSINSHFLRQQAKQQNIHSNEGCSIKTTGHPIILTKSEAVQLTAVSENYSSTSHVNFCSNYKMIGMTWYALSMYQRFSSSTVIIW